MRKPVGTCGAKGYRRAHFRLNRSSFTWIVGALLSGALGPSALAQDETAALNPLHGLSKESLRGFRERPLFNPSRTTPQAAPPEAAPPAAEATPLAPEQPPNIRIVGIVSGSRDLALVRLADGGPPTYLATGDKLGTWRVTVLPAGVRLEADARSVEIALFAPKGVVQKTAPGAAPDAPPPNEQPTP